MRRKELAMEKKMYRYMLSKDCFNGIKNAIERNGHEYVYVPDDEEEIIFHHVNGLYKCLDYDHDENVEIECDLEPDIFWKYCEESGWDGEIILE